jgi:hypothetical protein
MMNLMGSYERPSTASNPWRRPIPATQYSLQIHLKGRMPSLANGQESNNTETVKMMKTLTAIGISAAIALAPLAAIAQTDTTAPAAGAAPAATDTMAPAKDSMKKSTKGKKHMAKKAKKPAEGTMAPAAPAANPQ